MHKLMEYICTELEEIERKADKEGKISMQEVQYADTLAHMKKNLLKADEMWDESEYSMGGGSYNMGGRSYERGGHSYARGGRGGNRGGGRGGRTGANQYGSYAMGGPYERGGNYSGGTEMMVSELRELMEQAPDDRTRSEFQRFIQKIEQM